MKMKMAQALKDIFKPMKLPLVFVCHGTGAFVLKSVSILLGYDLSLF